jgi:hypothetical protein
VTSASRASTLSGCRTMSLPALRVNLPSPLVDIRVNCPGLFDSVADDRLTAISSCTARTGAEPSQRAGVWDVSVSCGQPRLRSGPTGALHPGEMVSVGPGLPARSDRIHRSRVPCPRRFRSCGSSAPTGWATSARFDRRPAPRRFPSGDGPRLPLGGGVASPSMGPQRVGQPGRPSASDRGDSDGAA